MIELNPRFLEKGGKKEFAVLPIEEFEQIMEIHFTLDAKCKINGLVFTLLAKCEV